MLRIALAIVLAAPLVVVPGSAAAGYVAAGLGSDAALTGDLDDHFDADSTGSSRIAFGIRQGPVALEASAFGAALARASFLGSEEEQAGDFTPISLGVDAKVFAPFFPLVEPYGRAGLSRTWLLTGDISGVSAYSGRGYALGGGVQVPFRTLPLVSAALWVDYTRHATVLADGSGAAPLEGGAHMMMVGLSVGTDL